MEELTVAAKAGDRVAMVKLADAYMDEAFWLVKPTGQNPAAASKAIEDRKKAFEWYTEAAKLGDVYAMYMIGNMYDNNYVYGATDEAALIWYQNAANKNYGDAVYRIALFQLVGRAGLKEDVQKAFATMTKAAELGSRDAAFTLGKIYAEGYWEFRRGMYKMGRFKYDPYYVTRDFPRDTQKAIYWLKKANDYGHPDAKARLIALGVIV